MNAPRLPRCVPLFAGIASFASMLPAATLPSPVWTKSFSVGTYYYLGAALDRSGNLIVSTDVRVQAISPSGDRLWNCDTPSSNWGVTVDATGNIFTAGTQLEGDGDPGHSDVVVTKISSAGGLLWSRTSGLPSAYDNAEKIVVDDQGGVYAAGYSKGTSGDIYLVKYDSAGALQWSRRFNGSADLEDTFAGLVAMPGGGVVLTGLTRNPSEQFVTIRYSAGGSAQWVSYYNAPDATEQKPCGIVRTSDGAIAVAGMSGDQTLATVKYAANGAELWANRTDLAAKGTAEDIVAGPDGGTAVLARRASAPALISVNAGGITIGSPAVPASPGGYDWTLTALPAGGYLISSGESSYAPGHLQDLCKLLGVDAGGGGAVLESWPNVGATENLYPGPLLTGPDGTVWALVRGRSGYSVKRFGPPPGPPEPIAPVVDTVTYDNLKTSSVRLKGTVNPNGAPATFHYEYGLTSAYGSATPERSLPGLVTAVDAFEPGVAVTAGTTYHFRLVASNSAGAAQSADQTFTVPQSAYQMWTVNAFGSLNAPDSGPNDDPDSDGITNLVEFTFGGNATVSSTLPGLPVFSLWESPESGITFPSIVYRPDPSATDVTITPVASNDLISWTSAGIVVTTLPDGSRRAAAQGLQRFMRLQITSP